MKKNIIFGLCMVTALSSAQVEAGGDYAAGKSKSESCGGCHGEDGNASAPIFPKLAGQHESYLIKQLKDFKSGKRVEPTMNAMAESLEDADIADIAAYFAKNKIKPEPVVRSDLGKRIYLAGLADKKIPACSACHGPQGAGNPTASVPALRGQYSAYLAKTLSDQKGVDRNNDANEVMRTIASRLSEDEINAVADYASGLQ